MRRLSILLLLVRLYVGSNRRASNANVSIKCGEDSGSCIKHFVPLVMVIYVMFFIVHLAVHLGNLLSYFHDCDNYSDQDDNDDAYVRM